MKQIIITEQPNGTWQLDYSENQQPTYTGIFPDYIGTDRLSADATADAIKKAILAAYELAR